MSEDKGLIDKQIMNVFEEQEDKFSFPITSQKEARDFVRLLNRHGCTYDTISKEVNEDEESFRNWRLGGGPLEIGKHVIERINKPFRDTMSFESEIDEKEQRNSLKDFYQFSFDEDEFSNSQKAKSSNKVGNTNDISPVKSPSSSIVKSNKEFKVTLSPTQPKAAGVPKVPSGMPATPAQPPISPKTSCFEPTKTQIGTNQSVSKNLPSPTQKTSVASNEITKSETRSAKNDQQISPTKETKTPQANSTPFIVLTKTTKHIDQTAVELSKVEHSEPNASRVSSTSKVHADHTIRRDVDKTLKPQSPLSKTSPSSPVASKPALQNSPTLFSQPASSSAPVSPASTASSNKILGDAPDENPDAERPPTPVTTSPHYQPYVANFTSEELEPLLNYNSDNQEENEKKGVEKSADGAGFIYVFSDIPGATMKVSKSTKFRVKVGVSRVPIGRLKQALIFNPDIRMLASIPIPSIKNRQTWIREKLKPLSMKNKLDWYWGTLNATFEALEGVLQKKQQ